MDAVRTLDDLMNILSRATSIESLDQLRHDLQDLSDPTKSAQELAAKWLTDAHND